MTRGDDLPVTDRTRIRRIAERQVTDRAMVRTILDHALVAHVAVVRDGMPVVVPFACARDGDSLLLHGSTGAGLLREAAARSPIAVGVTLVDGLVVARSVFDNSMNYRSLVAFGVPEVVDGPGKEEALRRLVDHLLPGRWDEARASNRRELAATLILRLRLDEVSVKVRAEAVTADPADGEDRAVWAGVLPTLTVPGDPVGHGDVPPGVDVPSSVRAAAERLLADAHRVQAAAVSAREDHHGLVKSLRLPPGFRAPTELAYGDLRARAISRADLADDVRGINASIELIQRTRGGGWPTEPVTEEDNYVDLIWHELEFREGYSFAYAVYDATGRYVGCCYLYPMGRRTPLTPDLLDHDVDVSWWVTPEAYERGYYAQLYEALRHWIADALPFQRPCYSNREIPDDADPAVSR